MTVYSDDQLISAHLRIRKTLDVEEAAWDERRKALKKMMQSLEGVLNARIIALGEGVNMIRTESGTVFNRQMTYVAVKDKDILRDYLLKSQDFSFLKLDVERKGVLDYMEANHGQEPPGVRVTNIINTLTRE